MRLCVSFCFDPFARKAMEMLRGTQQGTTRRAGVVAVSYPADGPSILGFFTLQLLAILFGAALVCVILRPLAVCLGWDWFN